MAGRTQAPSPRHGILRRAARWIVALLLAVPVLAITASIALNLMLFGAPGGSGQFAADWRRVWLAHALETGRVSPREAFQEIYGDSLGEAPQAQEVRRWLASRMADGKPIVWDVILARYLIERYGAIDGCSVPPGVYVAAGPIGPDGWPAPIFTQFLLFPRHGYILVVPEASGDPPRPALEATASLRRDFRPGGDGDDLFAVVQAYRPGAYDFPTPGEPVHDLFLLSSDPHDIVTVEARIRAAAAKQLDRAELGYGLFSRNSNSALRCFLRVSGLPAEKADAIRDRPLVRLRLPGIARDLWKAGEPNAIPECAPG